MEPIYYSLNDSAARTAHNANSFREFRSDDAEYRAEVDKAYELAKNAAGLCPERADEVYDLADRYALRLAGWYNKGYSIDSMCPSIMISGGANFPVRKKEKQNAARDGHHGEYEKIKGLLEKIRRIGNGAHIIKSNDENAADKLRAVIEKMEANHEAMKKANADARRNGQEPPCPAWMLSNNRQNINAKKKRLAGLESVKERGTDSKTVTVEGEDVQVIENTELMRLQFVFPDKPSDEVRAVLKRWAFKWSPKNKAWQRQLTGNARYAAESVIKEIAE